MPLLNKPYTNGAEVDSFHLPLSYKHAETMTQITHDSDAIM